VRLPRSAFRASYPEWIARHRLAIVAGAASLAAVGAALALTLALPGGLAVALAECAIAGGIGAAVELPDGLDPYAEAPGQAFVVSGSPEALTRAAGQDGGLVTIIGTVTGASLRIEGQLELAVSELDRVWQSGLAEFL